MEQEENVNWRFYDALEAEKVKLIEDIEDEILIIKASNKSDLEKEKLITALNEKIEKIQNFSEKDVQKAKTEKNVMEFMERMNPSAIVGEKFRNVPIFKQVYETGKFYGKEEGYKESSIIYENKLKKQASHFFDQKAILVDQLDDYNKLLKKYEIYIEEQEAQIDYLSKEQLKALYWNRNDYEKLIKIKH